MMAINNSRIAKNTILLYLRMILLMAVSLYTSREILRILGVEDFGVYNVVAGVIVLFSFVNHSMIATTQRFLNVEIGKDDNDKANNVFSMCLNIHIIIAFIVFVCGETLGLWLFYQLEIPLARQSVAFWVYQLSIATTAVAIIRSPYNACIIAYERMSMFAYISILEAFFKLAIVYVLLTDLIDRLALYTILTLIITIIIFTIYYIYCRCNFSITHYKWIWERSTFIQLIGFSSWSLLGSLALLGVGQGVSMILNVFHGVVANAAMGVANQVNSAIYGFSSNFQMAFNPQIVKSYATNDMNSCLSLIYKTSKFSYYLVLFLALPAVYYCAEILDIWLVDVPNYAISLTRLIICCSLLEALAAPLWMGVHATGNIRLYQIVISIILCSNLPLCYMVLKLGASPVSILYVRLGVYGGLWAYRLYYMCKVMPFSIIKYIKDVLFPIIFTSVITYSVLFGADIISKQLEMYNLFTILIGTIITCVTIVIIGLNFEEKSMLINFIKSKFTNISRMS